MRIILFFKYSNILYKAHNEYDMKMTDKLDKVLQSLNARM